MNNRKVVNQILNDRKKVALSLAAANLDIANKDAQFRDIDKQIRILTVDIAKSKHFNQDISTLTAKLNDLKSQRQQTLVALGLDESSIAPQYYCKLCNDSGLIDGKICKCVNDIIIENNTHCNNLNPNFTFENAIQKDNHNAKVFSKVKQSIAESFFQVLILGKVGVGKTYLANCIANSFLTDRSIIYVSAFNFNIDMLDAHIKDPSLLNQYLTCDLLVIDDLGTEPMYNNVTAEYLFIVINQRYIDKKPTVFTTNLDLNGISLRYSERILSRLADKSVSTVVELVGSDRRFAK